MSDHAQKQQDDDPIDPVETERGAEAGEREIADDQGPGDGDVSMTEEESEAGAS
jgi:hypothetical protein